MIEPLGPLATATPGRAPPAASSVGVEFEATILRPLIETMLPQSDTVFGDGPESDVWRGMLADTLARELAEAGGFGFAKHVAPAPEGADG